MYADRRAVVVTKACERHSAALLQIADVIVLILLIIIIYWIPADACVIVLKFAAFSILHNSYGANVREICWPLYDAVATANCEQLKRAINTPISFIVWRGTVPT